MVCFSRVADVSSVSGLRRSRRNKNNLRTIEAQIVQRLDQNLLVLIKKKACSI